VLYISPLKALAVDVERNLRAPIAGIAQRAAARGDAFHAPVVAVRTGDTPQAERARFRREPADILITTPESLYLPLTSNAREALRSGSRLSSSTKFTRSCPPSAARTSRSRSSGCRR
jgi:ATP-dependent Lhr-like helicase